MFQRCAPSIQRMKRTVWVAAVSLVAIAAATLLLLARPGVSLDGFRARVVAWDKRAAAETGARTPLVGPAARGNAWDAYAAPSEVHR